MLTKDQIPHASDGGDVDAGASRERDVESSTDAASQPSRFPLDELPARLESLLNDVNQKATGTFACAKMLPEAPNPALAIQDYGLVGLPLSITAAASLARLASQAPFGKGSETVIDTSVRNTWEIAANRIKMENPRWNIFVDELVNEIAATLGVDGSVQAQLYKLLIYEEGGFFHTHRDSEKADGMFATLVIALPSEHSGGDVVVSFQGETKTLQTAPSSRLGYSCLSWYADVEHEVLQVTEGYRVALTYNLCHDLHHIAPRTAKSLGDSNLPLQNFFADWEAHGAKDGPQYLTYVLDHQYTDANLQMSQLKGRDRLKAQALLDASRVSKMTILLANIEKEISGTCEICDTEGDFPDGTHWYEEESYKEDCSFSLVVDSDGGVVGRNWAVNEELIVQHETFNGNPDQCECEGYLGNQPGETTHTFRRTSFIVIQTPNKLKFYFDAVFPVYDLQGLDAWIDGGHTEEQLRQLCDWMLLRQPRDRRLESYLPWRVIKTACELQSCLLFNIAAILADASIYAPAVPAIGRLVAIPFPEWETGLSKLLSKRRVFFKTHEMTETILQAAKKSSGADGAGNPDVLEAYLNQKLPFLFSAINPKSADDGRALVQLAMRNESQYIFRSILPVIKAEVSNIFVVTGFLNRLADAHDQEEIDPAVAKNIFRDVVSNLASDMQLEGKDNPFSGPDLAELVSRCLKFDFQPEVAQLLQSIAAAALHLRASAYRWAIIPFMEKLSRVLDEHNIISSDGDDASRNVFATFTKEVLNAYWIAIMPKHPTPPNGWKQDVLNCRCERCRVLDDFLQDPCQESTQIQTKDAWHVPWELDRAWVDCKEVSSGGNRVVGDPTTLRVTKRANRYDELVKERQKKLGDAVDELLRSLEKIGIETLEALLGSDLFSLPLKSCPWVTAAEGR